MRRIVYGVASLTLSAVLLAGSAAGRGGEGQERQPPPPAPDYQVQPRLVDAEAGAARTLLGWPAVRGTCRIERAVRPIELTYG